MKIFLLSFATLILISAGCNNSPTKAPTATIGNDTITLEVVNDAESKRKGLSNRDGIDSDNGMLFDFREEINRKPNFWMKDMRFAIDIIWIKDNKIIHINEDVPPPKSITDQLPTYGPPSEIDFVLEVQSGLSKGSEWKIGDEIKLRL